MFHSRHFHCKPLAEGIYALEAKEQGGAMSNAGIINMGDYTLIFDTFNTPQAGKDLREAAHYLFDQPIKYIINSHWHGDHVRGNQHFSEEIIVSSKTTRELIMKTQPDWLNRMKSLLPNLDEDILNLKASLDQEHNSSNQQELNSKLSYLLEIQESILTLKVTPPELTYDRALTLHGSARTVELLSVGAAHTSCDTILYSPSDSIAFVGDVIAVDNHPLLVDGDPLSWLEALTRIEKLQIDQIVPGHGPVTSSRYIQQIRQYINDLIRISEEMVLERGTVDKSGTVDVNDSVDVDRLNVNETMNVNQIEIPEPYLHWKFGSIFYRNLEFLIKTAAH